MNDRDTRLVQAAKAGSVDAVERLFDRYWRPTWQTAYAITMRRDLADEVAQEAWVRAMGAMSRFDERRPFRPWVMRIAANRAIDVLRDESRLVSLDGRVEQAAEESQGSDDDLLDAVRGLGTERRLVVVLHYWLGMEVKEVGELLGIPAGTAASRLSRALEELRHRLEVDHV
ncbi:MAG: sigma-70 family RNA polymerase sigma factor [Thermoleophilia bacterium]|nr:sigma-70 family RNA polymerase sigma factor [Thermoleophilia bacterium]